MNESSGSRFDGNQQLEHNQLVKVYLSNFVPTSFYLIFLRLSLENLFQIKIYLKKKVNIKTK